MFCVFSEKCMQIKYAKWDLGMRGEKYINRFKMVLKPCDILCKGVIMQV